jgi:hypothetical protein
MCHWVVYKCYLAEFTEFTNMLRVGQNRMSALYMTVCMVVCLQKIPCVHRMYL